MCKQLAWFSEIMHQHGANCWVDSGTLLGLIRENRLLPNDTDIDLGIWAEDIPGLLRAACFFEKAGYRVVKEYYENQIFKCKLEHRHKKERTIDINIFRRKEGYAWCPQKFVPPNPYKLFDPRFWLLSCVQFPICFAWKNLVKSTSITDLPWSFISDIRTWWIPESYFENVEFLAKWDVYAPSNYKNYLTLRYGDWRSPDSNWIFWEQDGALAHKHPMELLR